MWVPAAVQGDFQAPDPDADKECESETVVDNGTTADRSDLESKRGVVIDVGREAVDDRICDGWGECSRSQFSPPIVVGITTEQFTAGANVVLAPRKRAAEPLSTTKSSLVGITTLAPLQLKFEFFMTDGSDPDGGTVRQSP